MLHSPEEGLVNYQHGKSLNPSLERSTCSRKVHTQCGSQEATSCSSGQGNQRDQVDKHAETLEFSYTGDGNENWFSGSKEQ